MKVAHGGVSWVSLRRESFSDVLKIGFSQLLSRILIGKGRNNVNEFYNERTAGSRRTLRSRHAKVES